MYINIMADDKKNEFKIPFVEMDDGSTIDLDLLAKEIKVVDWDKLHRAVERQRINRLHKERLLGKKLEPFKPKQTKVHSFTCSSFLHDLIDPYATEKLRDGKPNYSQALRKILSEFFDIPIELTYPETWKKVHPNHRDKKS